jgi:dipeptidyl-peptidase III
LVASAEKLPSTTHDVAGLTGAGSTKLTVEYGDFAGPLEKAVKALTEAKKHAANENQVAMINGYISS